MSPPVLAKLIERLATQQAAQAQRRNHRRRGGDRQSGARGGIFCEKITDAERVLAVILGLRKICTWEVVAELFEVSRRSPPRRPSAGEHPVDGVHSPCSGSARTRGSAGR